jgi:hypothetical protein
LWNLSLTLDELGERAQAIHHAEQALTIFEQLKILTPRTCAQNLPSGASKQASETLDRNSRDYYRTYGNQFLAKRVRFK